MYDLACGLKAALMAHENPIQPVCLYTEDRALTAAAMLAAAAEGAPPLLLPYALNPNVLREIHASTGACRVITDRPHDLPSPMMPVDFTPAAFPSPGLSAAPMDKVIVRLFTGGSTGKPQVWPKTVGNLFGEAFFMVEKFNFSHEDRFVSTTVPYHIYGLLFAVLVPLVASARVTGGPSIYPRGHHGCHCTPQNHRICWSSLALPGPSRRHVSRPTTCAWPFLRPGASNRKMATAFFRQTGVGVTEVYGSTETGGVAARNRAIDETDPDAAGVGGHSHRRRTLYGFAPPTSPPASKPMRMGFSSPETGFRETPIAVLCSWDGQTVSSKWAANGWIWKACRPA